MSSKVLKGAKTTLKINGREITGFSDILLDIGATKSGRWTWGQAIQNLPKEPPFTVDYGEMECRMISAMYPGADGIGADVVEERVIGKHPSLGAPYIAADILTDSDVIYANTHRAKIKRFDPNKDSVEIEFNDKALIPPTMWVPIYDVRQAWGGRVINTQTHCPKCEIPWKETMLARFSVWDCPGCGAKKEDHAR